MTNFQTALNAFDGISAPAGFVATNSGTFVPADILTGHGADWGSPIAYNDVAAMNAAVDEQQLSERQSLWSAVADVEADYRNLKIDGREG